MWGVLKMIIKKGRVCYKMQPFCTARCFGSFDSFCFPRLLGHGCDKSNPFGYRVRMYI